MVNFKNPSFVKLGEVDYSVGLSMVSNLLIEEEFIFASFKGMRDICQPRFVYLDGDNHRPSRR